MAKKKKTAKRSRSSTGKKRPQALTAKRNSPTLTEKQKNFLHAYGEVCTIVAAAERAGIDPTTHHKSWMKNPVYAEAFREVTDTAVKASMMARAHERGIDGVPETVEERIYERGEDPKTGEPVQKLVKVQTRQVTRRSDSIFIWLMNHRFGDPRKKLEISGPGGGPIDISTRSSIDMLYERLDQQAQRIQAREDLAS